MRRLRLIAAVLAAFVIGECMLTPEALATVTSQTRSVTYVGSGGTVFSVTFPFLAKAHIRVTKTLIATGVATVLAQCVTADPSCGYTVRLPAGTVNGQVTTTAAVTSSYTLTIDRVVPVTQETAFRSQGSYSPILHENAFDKLTMIAQQLQAAAGSDGQSAVDTHVGLADPHTQYALLAGRSGGQTLTGGTGAGDSVWLKSSSNGTLGAIKHGSTGNELYVDDVNNRVGINTSTPSCELQVAGELVAASNTANAVGGTFTGNGSGAGVSGTGGATNAAGVSGTGGATNGAGVSGTGTGTGAGVVGTGGASNGRGVTAQGTGSGTGIVAIGGATAGAAGDFTGGAGNSYAITATTAGNAPVAYFNATGAFTGAVRAYAVNSNQPAMDAQNGGSGYGVSAYSATGISVFADGDTTSPANPPLYIRPQDSDPPCAGGVGVSGGVYVNSVDGSFRHCDGTKWNSDGNIGVVKLTTSRLDNVGFSTFTDCVGLSFAVTSGTTYHFRATIIYDSAATATGAVFAVSGPAFTRLGYRSRYSLTTSSEITNYVSAYDSPAAAAATSAMTTGNTASLEGTVTPSANGTLIVRFATETDGSAITIQAGSILEYWTP